MKHTCKTSGVCAKLITFELDNGIVSDIKFIGGCSGNTQGVAKLAEGMKAEELIEKLSGIRCDFKGTSCPDQLAKAVKSKL